MTPTAHPPLHPELEFVLDLVRQCVPVALAYQAAGGGVLDLQHKPHGGGPITNADRDLNRRLVTALATRFPGDAILAEESADDGAWRTAHRCWHVDPIDGTREFARGCEDWTIQVGLCIEGRPALGVVAEPGTKRLTWGLVDADEAIAMQCVDGAPPTPLRAAPSPGGLDDLVLIGTTPYPLSRQQAVRRALAVDRERTVAVGSVGVRMMSIARGDADVYVQPPGRPKLWDTCAPEAILHAAGALVTDLRGRPLSYRGTSTAHACGVIASAAALHPTIVDRLAPLADRWLG